MKIKVIACGVLEPELLKVAQESPNEVEVELLEAGLHDRPDLLREQVQAAIERAEAEGCEAVAIGYGLCGRGLSGVIARSVPVVIPRAHDCMTLFLGSRQAYREQFGRNPGTFYITAGWYEHKVRPIGHEKEKYYEVHEDVTQDPRYAPWEEQFGHDEALHLIEFHDSWKRNYSRAAFIDTGLDDKSRYEEFAQSMAEALGWDYEAVRGDPHLLEKLLNGPWEDSEFLVLRPGQRSVASGDDGLLAAIELEEEASPADIEETSPPGPLSTEGTSPPTPLHTVERGERHGTAPAAVGGVSDPDAVSGYTAASSSLGLGIDAGGTYTDCVVYDLRSRAVLAKAKALTTHHNLSVGIEESLRKLELPQPDAIRMVALSTTLATNSIVEGKGGRPGALIMSPLSGAENDIAWRPMRFLPGVMDIRGDELEPPDPVAIQRAIRELLAEGVDALAVSGYASVRNPDHELQVRELVRGLCDLPIICGHELSSRLGYIARANTAILNARLLSVIRHLLDAVRESLRSLGVTAPIMVVKGDGSLIGEAVALERPVETILSGPAASVSGARHLTDVSDGLVFDMGGTTTDSATLSQGLVRIAPEGATVGGWKTSVEAADIATIGLGGDSHLSFNADRALFVGPRRVVPICNLAAEHPEVRATLDRFDHNGVTNRSTPQLLEFFRLGRDHEDAPLTDRQRAVVEALQGGPLARERLSRKLRLIEPSLLRTEDLEDLGYVQRSALTPTDLLHVTGEFTAFDVDAARTALDFFAGLYGVEPLALIELVREEIVKRLCLEVLRHVTGRQLAGEADRVLLALGLAASPPSPLSVAITYAHTLVAIGAPVHPFFPEVARRLNCQLVIPPHAEVANAIGAIASEVVVREQAIVRPGELAAYVVHTRSGKREYEKLEQAVQAARQTAHDLAVQRAGLSGATRPQVRIDVNERRGMLADGQEELIEVRIEATASGRPELDAAT
jgi:N-methylhydantoinase A/oxoprolinase/acetone carboxylase beta subunit